MERATNTRFAPHVHISMVAHVRLHNPGSHRLPHA